MVDQNKLNCTNLLLNNIASSKYKMSHMLNSKQLLLIINLYVLLATTTLCPTSSLSNRNFTCVRLSTVRPFSVIVWKSSLSVCSSSLSPLTLF